MSDEQGLKKKDDSGKILNGSLLLKLLLLAGVLLIVSAFIFGLELTIGGIFWTFMKIFVGVLIIALVFVGIKAGLDAPAFSPTKSFKEKLMRAAELSKPFNVKELFLRGEDMRVFSRWGKIVGLLFIPYLSSVPIIEHGQKVYVNKTDKFGNDIKDEDGKLIKIPKMKTVTHKDGDWFFVTKRGWWIFGQKDLVRANRILVSEIGEQVWIKDVNLVPFAGVHYPNKQWQSEMHRCIAQHQVETIIETHTEFLDIVAHVTQMSLGGDPTFQKIMLANSEQIANKNSGALVQQ